ncbi:hypothetical protein I7I52_01693 [Histoplasma capsulatum]|uniref:Uncharacterized protein n=1 Tax=Ajellomyces capsulatus TaxID=5037 RepID=A0A8H7Z3T3_AJECA|nr:hypothetical protein I7I52_01693 [Histoplasma capsulatum]
MGGSLETYPKIHPYTYIQYFFFFFFHLSCVLIAKFGIYFNDTVSPFDSGFGWRFQFESRTRQTRQHGAGRPNSPQHVPSANRLRTNASSAIHIRFYPTTPSHPFHPLSSLRNNLPAFPLFSH